MLSEPRIEFDPALPISAHADDIAALIAAHPVVIVAGETGSGKTTQLPKILLRMGRRSIGHTQPRRIAARTVAERVAWEMGGDLGDLVGYQVRFTRRAGRATRLKVMTDGVLLAEIGHDRDLRRYDTIIIDEAHERSLNIDFLLGYLKGLLARRPDLKVVVTSATIDTARFSAHFDNAPVLQVAGRTYPVETRYRPLAGDPEGEEIDQNEGIARAVTELVAAGPGDLLVFLSGEREIRDAAESIAGLKLPDTEVLPLFARLSAAEQQRVFQPHTGRRIVLATNVAETSITVPGIRYVIDVGTARISRYSARTKVQRLPIEPISQASANQRAGRCGRVAPGICIRLYSEQDYLGRPEFTEPEVLRTNLASVILQMAQAGLGDIAGFGFVEAPDKGQITDGMRLLDELGALQPGRRDGVRLTRIGRKLARIPLDPRLGRMLLEADRLGCVREVQVIVAGLAIPDVRERPADHREQADALHRRFWADEPVEAPAGQPGSGGTATRRGSGSAGSRNRPEASGVRAPARFTAHTGWKGFARDGEHAGPGQGTGGPADPAGDIAAMLRLWRYLNRQRKATTGNQFRRLCREEFINYLRVREWEDLRAQLREICKELELTVNEQPASTESVLKAVLAGLLSHVGLLEVKDPKQPRDQSGRGRRPGPREYLGGRGARFAIQPGSSLAKHPPELVMAVELVETSRLWARTVAGIRADWVEEVGEHALKRSYSTPYWSSSAGAVLAHERVSLYGVPIIADRPVHYARIDPELARNEFIRAALVEGQWKANYPFIAHNAAIRAEAESLEERSRRRDIVLEESAIAQFYQRRIPAEVVSASHFEAWWRRQGDPHVLDMSIEDLIDPTSAAIDTGAFPDHWPVAGLDLAVSYVFDPGSGADGVTVSVPLAQINQLDAEPFSWQVPGLRHELATQLIRSLPKSLRIHFVPAPDWANRALLWLDQNQPDHSRAFSLELGRALLALTGVQVPADSWQPEQVPDHLRVTFAVTEHGQVSRTSKQFTDLRIELAGRVSQSLTRASAKRAVTGATDWTFGSVARELELRRGQLTAVGYPCLRDEGASVGVVVLDSVQAQTTSHARGVRRLLVLTNPDPTKWVVSHLSNPDKLVLGASPYGSVPALLADARLKTVDRIARSHADLSDIRDAEAYAALALAVRQEQADTMRQVAATAAETLGRAQEVRSAMGRLGPDSPARIEVGDQLANLVFENFISTIPDPWYDHLPRYLRAMTARLEAAAANPARDGLLADPIAELEDEYAELCDAQPPGPLAAQVAEIGYLIEELRVQVFAQQLRTSTTVSAKRIRKAIESLRR